MRCYIIGDPVKHSFSPFLHNAVYKKLGIDKGYHYDTEHVESRDLSDAVQRMRSPEVRGVSVTVPHKIAVMRYLDTIDPLAERIGAVNTIVNEDGNLHGYNTDAEGIIKPILQRTQTENLNGKTALVVGAGGAARAAVLALAEAKATVTVTNRTHAKAQELADEVNGKTTKMSAIDASEYDIVFNATSVGMGEQNNHDTPLPHAHFKKDQIVFDAVYVPHETQFLKYAQNSGANVIYGIEMLATQATGQIKRFTGHDVQLQTVLDILKEKL